jgi:LDH2 family malate/lactate/ureidoglycolate dehydrogenase
MTEVNDTTKIYDAADLRAFAQALLTAGGMEAEKAATVAEVLLEADLMGHTTHGLHLAAPYLEELANRTMLGQGQPDVVSERGAVVVWDGRYLPGPWLTVRAIDEAAARARAYGIAAITVRRSHHIACLAAYLETATRQGLMILLACSDPSDRTVAPFGGRRAVFTPNPIAIGIPTGGEPILIDISASITTNGLSARLRGEGRRYPGKWALDAAGYPSDDPAVLFADPPGTILPLGGTEYGHKGYGLALAIEALTQGLGGYGRAEAPKEWGASVFVEVFDPAAFGGASPFEREIDWIVGACRSNPPASGVDAVRLPGERALALKRHALANGVRLYPGIMTALKSWARKLGVRIPEPMRA